MKKCLSFLLCLALLCLSFTACSSTNTEMTEENVTESVNVAFAALKEFDTDTLEKYVNSSTLTVIFSYAEEHEQFVELGQAIFENLTYEITGIDLENGTVTLSVQNKDLYRVASDFATNLKENYSTLQLLDRLSNDGFLDAQLGNLNALIAAAEMSSMPTEITLVITPGEKNLVFSFDEYAEDAVSGGALSAIKEIYA